MPKPNKHHIHREHHSAPKPPSEFLWIMEAALISLAIFAVLSVALIIYLAYNNNQRAREAIKSATGIAITQDVSEIYRPITSSLGYQITINTETQKAEAIKSNGALVKDSSIYQQSDYATLNVYNRYFSESDSIDYASRAKATYLSIEASTDTNFFNSLKKQYGLSLDEIQLMEKYYQPQDTFDKNYKLVSKDKINLGGVDYTKYVWEVSNNALIDIKTLQTDYLTVQNGRPYKVTIYQNSGYDPKDMAEFVGLVGKIKYLQTSLISSAGTPAKQGLKPWYLPGGTANASTDKISSDSAIQVVAKNMPGVVKVASVYCIDFDLALDQISQPISTGCSGGTGSGFIVTPNGYVATNGHVVKFTPYDVLVDSFYLKNQKVTKGYLDFLVKIGKINTTTANYYYNQAIAGNEKVQDDLVTSLQLLPEQTTTRVIKEQGYYAVQLSNKAVKFNEGDLTVFNFSDNIVKASLVDVNYDPYADVAKNGFNSSDVALLKLDQAKEYPFLALGSIDGLGTGSPLTVIGFPGLAENELVNTSESIPTATEGKVSSIRTASGTSNKLIQSDVSIAHGNSGGPALNSSGEVVGIATYAIEEQGANVNYMRDIADLKALLSKNGISAPQFPTGTEKLWQDGLRKYSRAYYSSAIADFRKVKELYPQNRLVDEFIAKAETAKKDGKEAVAPEVYTAVVVVVVVVIIIPGSILFFVVAHHRKRKVAHQQYMQNRPLVTATMPISGEPAPKENSKQNPGSLKTDMIQHAEKTQPSNKSKDTTNG
jgi:hypothetical protein